MQKNDLSRIRGGALAKSAGATAEAAAELSFNRYQANSLIAWSKTYPEAKVTGKDSRGRIIVRFTGNGAPDYCICLRQQGGRLLWLEIKTWQARDDHAHDKGIHQYQQMIEAASAGALAAYLVLWRFTNGGHEWRLHYIQDLYFNGRTINFCRMDGWKVEDTDGWPDWLAVVQ
jgi:hypothetical protein